MDLLANVLIEIRATLKATGQLSISNSRWRDDLSDNICRYNATSDQQIVLDT